MATRRDVERLSGALDGSVSLALDDLSAWLHSVDLGHPERVRDELLEVLPRLVDRYGDLAATAAAEWYESLRAEAVSGAYSASLSGGIPADQVQSTARWAAGALWEDDPTSVLQVLAGPLGRFIRYGGRDTIEQNAMRDRARPRYARVPSRTGCCAWCRMLASRGFVYGSQQKASGHEYHDHCGCQAVPEWGAMHSHIEGYDPDTYLAEYKAARAEAIKAGLPATDSNIAAFMRRMNPHTLTDGVAA